MKKAFTMIELVFVIVIIGILSAVLAPNFKSHSLQKAANQIISHIRYTQHLAMNDNKFENNDTTWFQTRWQIQFRSNKAKNKWAYVVYSDLSKSGNPNSKKQVARNPEDPSRWLAGWDGITAIGDSYTKTLDLTKSFGITNVTLNGGCDGLRISFDNIGRPFKGLPTSQANAYEMDRIIKTRCNIVLTGEDDKTTTIAIEPETGYAHQL